jgi:hypothetical protein
MTKWMLVSMVAAGAAWAGTPADELPVPVKFSVTSPGSKEALLSGELALVPNRASTIERHAPRGREKQEVTFDLRALDGGLLLVRAQWVDMTEDGELVKWEPSLVVKRSAAVEVRLDFPGGARVLKLTAG